MFAPAGRQSLVGESGIQRGGGFLEMALEFEVAGFLENILLSKAIEARQQKESGHRSKESFHKSKTQGGESKVIGSK